jgi:hypothetical protein
MANLFCGAIAGRFVAVQAGGHKKRGTLDVRIDHIVGILPLGLLGDETFRTSHFTSSRTCQKYPDKDRVRQALNFYGRQVIHPVSTGTSKNIFHAQIP